MSDETKWIWVRPGCKVEDSHGHVVAKVSVARVDEAELNKRGHLLAAAPAMRKALQKAAAYMEGMLEGEETHPELETLAECDAALALARGETESQPS